MIANIAVMFGVAIAICFIIDWDISEPTDDHQPSK
jgi:hypothetical protein